MKSVAEVFEAARAAGRPGCSFEIFPPKGEMAAEEARVLAGELAQLGPDFISVTYSAGGSGNKASTAQAAAMLQDSFGVPSVAHLTCAGATAAEIDERAADLEARGIRNVLALRGDAAGASDEFKLARDLIERLSARGFCVGGAAYPEGHITCFSMRENIEHLKAKQDAGAAFLVTQIFYDNEVLYRFLEAARAGGVEIPIFCGVMPFMSRSQLERMVFMCAASLPAPIIKLLALHQDDPDALFAAGVEYASAQLCDLAAHGVDGLHIYCMNKPEIARANVAALREAGVL